MASYRLKRAPRQGVKQATKTYCRKAFANVRYGLTAGIGATYSITSLAVASSDADSTLRKWTSGLGGANIRFGSTGPFFGHGFYISLSAGGSSLASVSTRF